MKPCPFCGAEDNLLGSNQQGSWWDCGNCLASGPMYNCIESGPVPADDKEAATIAWNKRVEIDYR